MLIKNLDDLPQPMKNVFSSMEKYAFECIIYHKLYSEQEIFNSFFDSEDIPDDFDGLG